LLLGKWVGRFRAKEIEDTENRIQAWVFGFYVIFGELCHWRLKILLSDSWDLQSWEMIITMSPAYCVRCLLPILKKSQQLQSTCQNGQRAIHLLTNQLPHRHALRPPNTKPSKIQPTIQPLLLASLRFHPFRRFHPLRRSTSTILNQKNPATKTSSSTSSP